MNHKSLPYFEDARLRERNFGEATGTHRDNHDWEQFWSHDDTVTIQGAKTLNEFTKRVKSFLDDVQKLPYTTALLVTHGGVLNRIQAIIDPQHTHITHKNTAIILVEI